jgi:hypothetical protein
MRILIAACAASAVLAATIPAASAQENYESWALLKNPFESTGGGGIMIDGYKPVIAGNTCVTDFTATEPAGKVYDNTIVFEAVPVRGGTLCTKGKWRAKDGSSSGTTPFRVFIKDGVVRRSP